MENASNALIIAGTILIAIIVLGIGVYLVANYSTVGESQEKRAIQEELEDYNRHFTSFINREDITTQEIVTLQRYNKLYEEKTGIKVEIIVIPNISNEVEKKKENSNSPHNAGTSVKYEGYKYDNIEYNEDTGRVKKIKFSRVEVEKEKPTD